MYPKVYLDLKKTTTGTLIQINQGLYCSSLGEVQ